MPFKAHELYREYEPDKYKTSTQKKVEGVLKEAEQAGLGKKEVILAFKGWRVPQPQAPGALHEGAQHDSREPG